MSEARELFEALADQLKKLAHLHVTKGNRDVAAALSNTRNAIAEALATQPQPEPGAVPELPEYVTGPDEHGDYWVQSVGGLIQFRANATSAETHERLAETHRILAARERARRAS